MHSGSSGLLQGLLWLHPLQHTQLKLGWALLHHCCWSWSSIVLASPKCWGLPLQIPSPGLCSWSQTSTSLHDSLQFWAFNSYWGCAFTNSFSWSLTVPNLHNPFTPSKPVPLPSSAARFKYNLVCLWNTASVCWPWGNASHKISPNDASLLLITADSLTPVKQRFHVQILNAKYHINGLIVLASFWTSPASAICPALTFLLFFQSSSNSSSNSISTQQLFQPKAANTSTIFPKEKGGLVIIAISHSLVLVYFLNLW